MTSFNELRAAQAKDLQQQIATHADLTQRSRLKADEFAARYLQESEATDERSRQAEYFAWRAIPIIRGMARHEDPAKAIQPEDADYATVIAKCRPARYSTSSGLMRAEMAFSAVMSLVLYLMIVLALTIPDAKFQFIKLLSRWYGLPVAFGGVFGVMLLGARMGLQGSLSTVLDTHWSVQGLTKGYALASRFAPLVVAVPSAAAWLVADFMHVTMHPVNGAMLALLPLARAFVEVRDRCKVT